MDPNQLKATLLEEATTEQQKAFAKMLAEQCAEAELQKHHRCWLFIPTHTEYERMKKFAQPPDYDRCPKCGKGRIILEIFKGSIGDSFHLVCRWGKEGCDFKEYVSDDDG